MNTSNIILIGMSGAGKSTLGVLLAKALGKHFADTDILIQQSTGRLLQQIIDTEGNERFLEIEEQTVLSSSLENCVIATGGSVVYSPRAMEFLKQGGTVVYLQVDYAEIASRLSNITTRGIVFRHANDLEGVLNERIPLYRAYADLTVSCTGRGIEDCVLELVTKLTEKENSL